MPRFAVARFPTPVLNSPDFFSCFGGTEKSRLPLDDQQLLRPVEIVLLPGSKIQLHENVSSSLIWRIGTKEHPVADDLYIDERFVAFVEDHFPERQRILPTMDTMSQDLIKLEGVSYIWGGNWPKGIPELLTWYKPHVAIEALDALTLDTWQLKGLDCSGLLYYVSNGFTPRNTSQLVDFGKPVSVEGKTGDTLAASLMPLDLIVWKGHVVIVLNPDTVVESKGGAGVVISTLKKRLCTITDERKPVDKYIAEEPTFV